MAKSRRIASHASNITPTIFTEQKKKIKCIIMLFLLTGRFMLSVEAKKKEEKEIFRESKKLLYRSIAIDLYIFTRCILYKMKRGINIDSHKSLGILAEIEDVVFTSVRKSGVQA